MNVRICKCCGEPMSESGNAHSRDPNLCASCSSMEDGDANSNLQASGFSETAIRKLEAAERFDASTLPPVNDVTM